MIDYAAIMAELKGGKSLRTIAAERKHAYSHLCKMMTKLYGDEYRAHIKRDDQGGYRGGGGVKKPPVARGTVLGWLYESGATYEAMSEAFGYAGNGIGYFLRRLPEFQDRQKMQRERHTTVDQLHGKGHASAEIAAAVGWTRDAVNTYLYKIGRKPNPPNQSAAVKAGWETRRKQAASRL